MLLTRSNCLAASPSTKSVSKYILEEETADNRIYQLASDISKDECYKELKLPPQHGGRKRCVKLPESPPIDWHFYR
jgi:hypothetical protein